ncbi:MAG: FecR domain-containing protein [Leptodesmis sp.]|uniref:FecR domain-containing protein n=1 Tax=Leptodesmis sp. TaxID=3100501 RepID=UPI003D145413
MITRSLLTFTLALCSAATLLPAIVSAQTPLNRATIQNLRNKVDLTAKQQTRPAQKADVMTPGDALRTYRQAMAELRFNDNSLARLGEQALFQFMPNSRNFDLQQGTVLLFITPGQGRTRIRTPNAAAGIRGSALFVRYIPDSKVTLIGALTNSGIEISNGDACNSSQTVALKAGQLGYVFNCQIGIYNFDLRKFQETSPLFKEANLDQNPEVSAEISQALSEQGTFVGNSESNPDWTKIAENRQTSPVAARPTNAKDLASIPFQPQVDATQVSKINSAAASAASSPSAAASVAPPAAIVTIVRPPEIPAAAPASTSLPSPPNDRPTPVTAPPISAPNTPSASVPERPTPPVQVPVTPTTSVTPTTPPTSAIPATPTTPATPAIPATPPVTGGAGATPATPATPAPVVVPPTTPTVVTSPPVTPTVTTPTATPVATTPAVTPVVDTPIIQPAPAPTPTTAPTTPTTSTTTPITTPVETGAGGQTPANTTRPVPIVQPVTQ